MRLFILGFLFLLTAVLPVFASIADINIMYASQYVWRGFEMNSDQPNIQPGIVLPLGDAGLSLSYWGNFNIGRVTKDEFTESDVIFDYSSSFKGFDYSIGYTYYTFPHLTDEDANATGEYYVGVGFPQIFLSPVLTVYYDYDDGDGWYSSLAGGYDFEIDEAVLSSSITVGYNHEQWGIDPGFSDISLGLSSSFDIGPVSVSPSVNYVIIPNNAQSNPDGAFVNVNPNEFWVGLDISGNI